VWLALMRTARDSRIALAQGQPISALSIDVAKRRRRQFYRTEIVFKKHRLTAGKETIVSEPIVTKTLTYDELKKAVESAAAFRCRRRLQPAGGEGDKVFPPTYAGAVYAVEQRRIPGKTDPVTCVVLDSVQSQANRMEEAMQDAVDDGLISIPLIMVDFAEADLSFEKPIGKVTSLTAPHRLADAILRDSWLKGTNTYFRDSDHARSWRKCEAKNATGVFRLCPTALVFGIWGSPDQPGGLGTKFERAIVSEVVGIGASFGLKTASRIDPLEIRTGAGPLYRAKSGGWTTDSADAVEEIDPKTTKPTGRKALFREKKKDGKSTLVFINPSDTKYPDEGKPSAANHGNIVPSFATYSTGATGPDVMRQPEVKASYRMSNAAGSFTNESAFEGGARDAREGQIAPGGATVDYIEQTTTLSLIQLRRLRFPLDEKSTATPEANVAARALLAALALGAATMAFAPGMDLRSRCLLFPEGPMVWGLLGKPGETPATFTLDIDSSKKLLDDAVAAAKKAKLPWNTDPIVLTPSKQLVELVAKSQALAITDVEGT
jgi:CRISPR-associated protein Csb1